LEAATSLADVRLRFASLRGLSFYDATYVALADSNCPLITVDGWRNERGLRAGCAY
jgi:predicted nucleic acid-binding protein